MKPWQRHRRRTPRTVLIGVTAAASLLGIQLHGFRHAHGTAHSHHQRLHEHCGLDHQHSSGSPHIEATESICAAVACHLHVVLFGFQVHLPEPAPHHSGQDDCGPESCALLCGKLTALGASNRPRLDVQCVAPECLPGGRAHDAAHFASESTGGVTADAHLSHLCDVARHERSGVLLI